MDKISTSSKTVCREKRSLIWKAPSSSQYKVQPLLYSHVELTIGFAWSNFSYLFFFKKMYSAELVIFKSDTI